MKNGFNPTNLLIFSLLISTVFSANGQRRPVSNVDTAYVRTYPRHLVGRVYLSQKYTNVDLLPSTDTPWLKYRPNTSLNLGLGATYGPLTVNLGYGFRFLNPDAAKGRTRYLDLQSHLYTRQWVFDVFGQFYTGYHLAPQGFAARDADAYYYRPDVRLQFFGLSGYRLFNNRRFSYRAALVQDEWQKKSAGSWLVGLELHGGSFRGDSSLVPGSVARQYPPPYVREIRFVKIGPGGGYAYTYVFRQCFFATASLTLNLGVNFSRETSEAGRTDAVSLRPNALYRLVVGYGNGGWNANLALVNNTVSVGDTELNYGYLVRTGQIRLTVAKRFVLGKRLRRIRKMVEEKLPVLPP